MNIKNIRLIYNLKEITVHYLSSEKPSIKQLSIHWKIPYSTLWRELKKIKRK